MPQTLDRLYAIDFMSLYSRSFGITDKDINGDNEYKFSEFASHRELVRAALKELVLDGMAQAVGYVNGMAYIITSDGIHDYLEEEALEDFIGQQDFSEEAFHELFNRASAKGSTDDKSMIVIKMWE